MQAKFYELIFIFEYFTICFLITPLFFDKFKKKINICLGIVKAFL